jgi:hypothetical protein
MEIVIHRINTIKALGMIPTIYGCEIDIRTDGSRLILNHDPFKGGDNFLDYLDKYRHGLLVLNIKEAGIEQFVLDEVRKRNISNHFVLDVEFPYIYRATREGERAIAIRYSEDEPVELVRKYNDKADWVWIDTNTMLPLNKHVITQFGRMKTCLVCPERWGRPQDILPYRRKMKDLNFSLSAVMTNIEYVHCWEQEI